MSRLSPLLKQATPVLAARGEGVYLFDEDGRRYLDFTAGIGVTSTGHCHPRVVAAAQDQVGRLIHGRPWPTFSLPKPLAQAGAWVQDEVLDQDPFIKPWMMKIAEDHYEPQQL